MRGASTRASLHLLLAPTHVDAADDHPVAVRIRPTSHLPPPRSLPRSPLGPENAGARRRESPWSEPSNHPTAWFRSITMAWSFPSTTHASLGAAHRRHRRCFPRHSHRTPPVDSPPADHPRPQREALHDRCEPLPRIPLLPLMFACSSPIPRHGRGSPPPHLFAAVVLLSAITSELIDELQVDPGGRRTPPPASQCLTAPRRSRPHSGRRHKLASGELKPPRALPWPPLDAPDRGLRPGALPRRFRGLLARLRRAQWPPAVNRRRGRSLGPNHPANPGLGPLTGGPYRLINPANNLVKLIKLC